MNCRQCQKLLNGPALEKVAEDMYTVDEYGIALKPAYMTLSPARLRLAYALGQLCLLLHLILKLLKLS